MREPFLWLFSHSRQKEEPMHAFATVLLGSCLLACTTLGAANAEAQDRRPAIDIAGGRAWFADESFLDHPHVTGGVSARFHLTSRLSVGPEVTYMIGRGPDRDLFIMANLTYEWPYPSGSRSARIVPFVIGSAGYMRHRPQFGSFVGHTDAYHGGVGARFRITDRVLAGPELRLGSQWHFRIGGIATVRLGS
jgi:hypothetical protein